MANDMTADFDTESSAKMALIVRLCGEALAIPVINVHEVIDPLPRTRVPRASALAPWLINVRGAVVPLVDIRERLRMSTGGATQGRIVVLEHATPAGPVRMALLADTVEEVVELDLTRIEELPEQGAPWPVEYVTGAMRRGDDLVLIINAETLFRPDGGTDPLS